MKLVNLTRRIFLLSNYLTWGVLLLFSLLWFMGVGLASAVSLTGITLETNTFMIGKMLIQTTVIIPLLAYLLVCLRVMGKSNWFKKLGIDIK